MKKTINRFDVIIIGSGPSGLSLAASLAQAHLRVCVLEKEKETVLAHPPEDGREIALTHGSMKMLRDIGILPHMPEKKISRIREAKVLDGSSSSYFLNFTPNDPEHDALGFIVPNDVIRKAAYDRVKKCKSVTLVSGVEVSALTTDVTKGIVTLKTGQAYEASLVVAADGRFSLNRRRMGISVSMQDFGRTVIVCRMKHEKPHEGVAYECFNYGRTLAVLPLPGNMSSIVITLSSSEAERVLVMPKMDFNRDVTDRFESRLGRMMLDGNLYPYPLVAIYANSFTATRFALLGDAAVGMHPVTAHGFNFGLKGQDVLASQIKEALRIGLDIGGDTVLSEYNRRHRAATLPLYLGTNALVSLYTDERPRAKLLRKVVMRMGNNVLPFKNFVSSYLEGAH